MKHNHDHADRKSSTAGRTMTRKEALTTLLEKVEANKFNGAMDVAEGLWGIYNEKTACVSNAYKGSLDAAIALHHAVLPGWFVEMKLWTMHDHMAIATVGNDFTGEANTLGRALLIADIKALIARCDE